MSACPWQPNCIQGNRICLSGTGSQWELWINENFESVSVYLFVRRLSSGRRTLTVLWDKESTSDAYSTRDSARESARDWPWLVQICPRCFEGAVKQMVWERAGWAACWQRSSAMLDVSKLNTTGNRPSDTTHNVLAPAAFPDIPHLMTSGWTDQFRAKLTDGQRMGQTPALTDMGMFFCWTRGRV